MMIIYDDRMMISYDDRDMGQDQDMGRDRDTGPGHLSSGIFLFSLQKSVFSVFNIAAGAFLLQRKNNILLKRKNHLKGLIDIILQVADVRDY